MHNTKYQHKRYVYNYLDYRNRKFTTTKQVLQWLLFTIVYEYTIMSLLGVSRQDGCLYLSMGMSMWTKIIMHIMYYIYMASTEIDYWIFNTITFKKSIVFIDHILFNINSMFFSTFNVWYDQILCHYSKVNRKRVCHDVLLLRQIRRIF